MTPATMTRAYALGLGYGCIWLVTACLASGILDMYDINTTVTGAVLSMLGVVLIGGALLYLCIRFLRLGYMLPRAASRRISVMGIRIFVGLILLEIVGWGVVNAVLAAHNLALWIVPMDLIIVGAHFIPLAFVFKVPAYLYMGILWIVAIIGSMLLLPSTTQVGHVSAWIVIPSICCIVITWLTALFLMTTEPARIRQVVQSA